MKWNIKKLAVFVIITVMAPFIVAGTTLANNRNAIQGEYAFTAAGSCFIALEGFTQGLTPNNPTHGAWITSSNTWEGVYKFERDGTGEFTAINRFVELSGPGLVALGSTPVPDAAAADMYWKFSYEVTDSGRITFTNIPLSSKVTYTFGMQAATIGMLDLPKPYYGLISQDNKNISFSWGIPLIVYPTDPSGNHVGVEIICNGLGQGFRCKQGKCPALVYTPSDP